MNALARISYVFFLVSDCDVPYAIERGSGKSLVRLLAIEEVCNKLSVSDCCV